MAKQFNIPAGTRKKVLWLFSSSIPGQVRFTAEPTDGEELSGKIELHRRSWFSWKEQDFPLNGRNVLEKGFGDADYRVFITPDQDCKVTFETRHFRAETYFVILGCVLGLGVVAGLTAFIFAPT